MKLDFKKLINKLSLLIPLVLLVFALFLKENDLTKFKYSTSERIDFKTWEAPFTITDVKKIFPNAVSYQENKKRAYIVFNSKKTELGIILNSCPFSNVIFGYAGRIPVLIGINNNQEIVGITLLENSESKESILAIEKKEFLNQWNNSNIDNFNILEVDAVSGATLTSNAISDGINARLSSYLNKIPTKEFALIEFLKIVTVTALFLFALLSYFRPKSFKKYRLILLSANIIVVGFWLGYSLSLFLIHSWIINGISLKVHLLLFSLLGLSILLPFFFDKAFYCSYLCPLGSCQELCGLVVKNKLKIKRNVAMTLKTIPKLILILIAFLLLIDYRANLSVIEPFLAFNYQTAKMYTLIFALIILVASIFISKPWCNYFCPTGQLLELIRKPNKSEE